MAARKTLFSEEKIDEAIDMSIIASRGGTLGIATLEFTAAIPSEIVTPTESQKLVSVFPFFLFDSSCHRA